MRATLPQYILPAMPLTLKEIARATEPELRRRLDVLAGMADDSSDELIAIQDELRHRAMGPVWTASHRRNDSIKPLVWLNVGLALIVVFVLSCVAILSYVKGTP